MKVSFLSDRVEEIEQAKPILFAEGRYTIKGNGKGNKRTKFHITVRQKNKITPVYEVTLGSNKCVQTQFPFLFSFFLLFFLSMLTCSSSSTQAKMCFQNTILCV